MFLCQLFETVPEKLHPEYIRRGLFLLLGTVELIIRRGSGILTFVLAHTRAKADVDETVESPAVVSAKEV